MDWPFPLMRFRDSRTTVEGAAGRTAMPTPLSKIQFASTTLPTPVRLNPKAFCVNVLNAM